MKLYAQLAVDLAALIRDGTLPQGARAPSVRQLCRDRGLSPATVIRAYEHLESRGFISSRPRSGFYVSGLWAESPPIPPVSRPAARSTQLDVSELIFDVLEATRDKAVVPLGSAFPNPAHFPLPVLARHLGSSARAMKGWNTIEDLPPGSLELRRQISRRYLHVGARVSPDEIVITSGALEALTLSLQSITRPGDLVAIESPAFYGCLQAIEALGLRAIELPTHPRDGVAPADLDHVLRKRPIRACWLMTSFQNPLGAKVPDEAKREIVRLLAAREVPLIEDSVYTELHFGRTRPHITKAHDRRGLVLDCGSFSKSLAPGYRIGWVAAGRYAYAIQRRKMMSTLATSIPIQGAIARYLDAGGYERFLGKLRGLLQTGQTRLLVALQQHLPTGFQVTRPDGGYFLWVQLAGSVDAIELHRRALTRGVSIAPGPIFSARRGFRNCIRLNYGHATDSQIDTGVRVLGELLRNT